MGYTIVGLKDKIMGFFPEIEKHGITFGLEYSGEKDAYILRFRKDGHELTTHLERKDADDCMNGIKCIALGVQVAQFMKNFEGK